MKTSNSASHPGKTELSLLGIALIFFWFLSQVPDGPSLLLLSTLAVLSGALTAASYVRKDRNSKRSSIHYTDGPTRARRRRKHLGDQRQEQG